MKVYICTNHDSHYPVGCASVVVAKDKKQARKLLDETLHEDGLKTSKDYDYILTELPTDEARAVILNNGEY